MWLFKINVAILKNWSLLWRGNYKKYLFEIGNCQFDDCENSVIVRVRKL